MGGRTGEGRAQAAGADERVAYGGGRTGGQVKPCCHSVTACKIYSRNNY